MDLQKLEVKTDDRGSLVEAFKFPEDGQLFYVIASPNETRGNHYHLRKTETFLVVYGSAEMTVKDRTTDDVIKVTLSGGRPMTVKVVPNHTHLITADSEGAIFLVWVDEQFNPDDPDTFMEEI